MGWGRRVRKGSNNDSNNRKGVTPLTPRSSRPRSLARLDALRPRSTPSWSRNGSRRLSTRQPQPLHYHLPTRRAADFSASALRRPTPTPSTSARSRGTEARWSAGEVILVSDGTNIR